MQKERGNEEKMTGIEICLLVAGIVFFAVSFMVGNKKEEHSEMVTLSHELSQQDRERIQAQIDVLVKAQVDEIIDGHIEAICEQTEAQLDKISNIMTLELNEYAETVIKEINKNHNEAVFLYDMLNEKAKEVKNTVKDVNIAKDQVIRMEHSLDKNWFNKDSIVDSKPSEGDVNSLITEQKNQMAPSSIIHNANTEALMDEMLANVMESEKTKVSQDNEHNNLKDIVSNSDDEELKDESYDKNENKNDKILSLYETGMSNKDIAKTLGLGVGEVKLVVDLYKGLR